MKNITHSFSDIVENKWCRAGFSLLLALILTGVLLFIPLAAGTTNILPAAWPAKQFPFGVTLVQAAGGLTITKSAPEFVAQGGILTYTLRITNNTGSVITHPIVIDPLVNEITCVQSNHKVLLNGVPDPTSQWGWGFGCSTSVAFTGQDIFNGDNVELIYWGEIIQPLPGGHKIVNSDYFIDSIIAYAAGPPVTTTVLAPSWEITKTTTSNTIEPGQPFEYTITVYNRGGSASSGVFTVTEELPNDAYYVIGSASPSNNFNRVGSTLTWTSTNIVNPGGSAQFSFKITVTESLTDTWPIVNSIYNVGGGGVVTPTTWGNPITVTVDSPIDLDITKIAGTNPVTVGSPLVYTLTVTNNGDGPASGVVVTDTLSPNVEYDSAVILGGIPGTVTPVAPHNNPIVFELTNPLVPGASVQMRVTTKVTTTLPSPATIINNYRVTAANATFPPKSLSVGVVPDAPHTLTVSVGDTSLQVCQTTPVTAELKDKFNNPIAGQVITLTAIGGGGKFLPSIVNPITGNTNSDGLFISTLRVFNGPEGATVRASTNGLSDVFFPGIIDINTPAIPTTIVVTVSPANVAINGNATATAEVLDCNNEPVAGEVVTFTASSLIPIVSPGTAIVGSNGLATTTVTAGPTPGNATITGTMAGPLWDTALLNIDFPNLTITKSALPAGGNVSPGETITYTLVVANSGGVAATNLVITDVLDSDVDFSGGSITGGGSGPTHNSGTVTFSAAGLGAGKALTATIRVTVKASAEAGTVITNTATAGSTETGNIGTSNMTTHQVSDSSISVYLPVVLK